MGGDPWTFRWSHGDAVVEPLGAMVAPVRFRLPSGRTVQPFDIWPWADEPCPPEETPLTGLMARGRGDWSCVPFGYRRAPDLLLPEWRAIAAGADDGPPHGESANGTWSLDVVSDGCLSLAIDYSGSGPVRRLRRIIAGKSGAPEIRITVEVEVRRSCRIPIGLHPVFALPVVAGAFEIEPGDFDFGMTWPGNFEPGISGLQAGAMFRSLASVPLRDGATVDLSRLPLIHPAEELVQLCRCDGQMVLRNHADDYLVRLRWDASVLPSCVLWISSGGRRHWPWSGRHFGVGVEPVCAAFDLGADASAGANPLALMGVPTAIAMTPGKPWTTSYSIAVESSE